MHRIRVYVDTSVFGGTQDDEFREASSRFFRVVEKGDYVVLVSDVTYDELIPAPDAVRAVSPSLKKRLCHHLSLESERVVVVPVGMTFEPETQTSEAKTAFKEAISEGLSAYPVVLYVGRFCPQKNLPLWLNVAAEIVKSVPDCRFILAGAGELKPHRQRQAADLGLTDHVIFTGTVAYQEMPRLYAAADLFLLTSRYEGFGRVVVEALASGIPAVATISTGPEDIIREGETGYLLGPSDMHGLAGRCIALLEAPEQRMAMGRTGQKDMRERFDISVVVATLIDAWASVAYKH